MSLTIDLPPHLEAELREEAARAGVDTGTFIRNALEERVRLERARQGPRKSLPQQEAELLQRINEGLPSETWERYHELIAKRRAETLQPDEHALLIELSDQIEAANARRITHLIELARLRQTSLEALMEQLGIKPLAAFDAYQEILEDTQIAKQALADLAAAGGDRKRAGGVEWDAVADEIG